ARAGRPAGDASNACKESSSDLRPRNLRPHLTHRRGLMPTMSEAPQPAHRTAALLDRLIDMDMAAAEHVHAQLLAATEPSEVASLSRAYNRCSRAVRQCMMLRMRYDKDRAEAEARADRT